MHMKKSWLDKFLDDAEEAAKDYPLRDVLLAVYGIATGRAIRIIREEDDVS